MYLLLLIFQSSLFSLSFFLLLIPSDIPYLQADTVSPVVYLLFLLQHDLMCLSNNKREERERRVGRRERRIERTGGWCAARYLRQSSTFFVICSPCGRKASHLLYYHQEMIRMAMTTHLCTKASWYLKVSYVCAHVWGQVFRPKITSGYLFLSCSYEIIVSVRFWDIGKSSTLYNGAQGWWHSTHQEMTELQSLGQK